METAKISNVAIYLIAELAKKSPNEACARGFERARNFKINKVNQDFSFSYKEINLFQIQKKKYNGDPTKIGQECRMETYFGNGIQMF